MNRYKASALHLLASALALFIIFLLIRQVWYPGILFALAAGSDLLRLIIGVDLVIGPLVMLIVYDAKKKYMKFDIVCVLVCQLAFMGYGFWSMFSSRPVFYVYADHHFYLVRANEIDPKELAKASSKEFSRLPLTGPIYVGTKEPDDIKIKNELALSGLGGDGIQNYPQYFVPYQQVVSDVIASGKSSKELGVESDTKKRVIEYELTHTTRPVRFLPMVNKRIPLIVVFDAKTAEIIDLI